MRWIIIAIAVLFASAAKANSSTIVNTKSGHFGAICDGKSHPLSERFSTLAEAQTIFPFITSLTQQIDFAALKGLSNLAFGEDGSEHGAENPGLNQAIYIPAGICELGTDEWLIRKLAGGRITGAGTLATIFHGSNPNGVLGFDGLWYSEIGYFSVVQDNGDATVALDIDGNVPSHPYATFGVQANIFPGLFVNAGHATYGLAFCRLGNSNAQCSENTLNNFHGSNASFAVYYQTGFNAIDNVMIGGDLQNYATNGIYLVAGSIKIFGTSFESTFGYNQILNSGCDINASSSGAFDSIVVYGARTESLCFYKGAWPQFADIKGLTHDPVAAGWSPNSNYPINYGTIQSGSDGNNHLFVAQNAGQSGAASPTWPANGTVTDGAVIWKVTSYYVVNFAEGEFDRHASRIDTSAQVYDGDAPAVLNCGTGAATIAGSNQRSGSVIEGTGASGCTLRWAFDTQSPNIPVFCSVTSPNGASLTRYSADTRNLIIVNPTSDGSQFSWICP